MNTTWKPDTAAGLNANSLANKFRQNYKRALRKDLTKEELERLEKYGSLEFKSAGAVRGWMVASEVLKAEAERIQGLINR